jgi:hypothetical protein
VMTDCQSVHFSCGSEITNFHCRPVDRRKEENWLR